MIKWNPIALRYQEMTNGQFVAQSTVLGYVDDLIAGAQSPLAGLAEAAGEFGGMAAGEFSSVMKLELKNIYIQEYLLGKGGVEQMKFADWGSIGGMLKEQYGYLDNFAQEVQAGNLTQGQIESRINMYINSAREAFHRANARARDIPTEQLPDFPGAGNTVCLTNCQCHWEYDPIRDANDIVVAWHCYWQLSGGADSCPTCISNALTYNPFIIEMEPPERSIVSVREVSGSRG